MLCKTNFIFFIRKICNIYFDVLKTIKQNKIIVFNYKFNVMLLMLFHEKKRYITAK